MWVCIDARFRGFPFTLTVSPLPNPVFATKGERSVRLLRSSRSSVNWINLESTEISDIELRSRRSAVRFVKLAKAAMSNILLL